MFPFLQEKSSHLSAALFGEDCEISHDQLYELLKYAALGKCHNATQPRYNTFIFRSQPCLVSSHVVKSIPKGILAMLDLESLQRSYHNDSLHYVDAVVVRLGQRPESLF